MVFVNDKKFACEACIKGHRSSSCCHSGRPLYKIKKKGRPVTQCPKCRELRSTKRVHSKCSCDDDAKSRSSEEMKSFGTKQRRYIPVAPTLPNGIQDMFPGKEDTGAEISVNPRQRVDTLLNPCRCTDVWSCNCSTKSSYAEAQNPSSSTLSTLARAAERPIVQTSDASAEPVLTRVPPKLRKRRALLTPLPKRRKQVFEPTRGPSLPPIVHAPPDCSAPAPSFTPHEMPSFTTLSSLAGSGCTCGVTCSCPGGTEHATDGSARCGDGCGHCVDPSTREVDLSAAGFGFSTSPQSRAPEENGGSVQRSTVLDDFFREAARLPAPPPLGGAPVAITKLCCGVSCGCGITCGCEAGCSRCGKDGKEDRPSQSPELASMPAPVPMPVPAPPRKSCCAH